MVDNIIFAVLYFGGFAASVIILLYYMLTLKRRTRNLFEDIKDTEWVVERWSPPSEIFDRYFLFGISIMIPFAVWGWLFDYELVSGVLLFAIWLVCFVPLAHHYLVRPSLRGTSYRTRNRNLDPGTVTSMIGMVLDDMGIPHDMYTFSEYETSGPDAGLIWEMRWQHHCHFIFDLHPAPSANRTYSIVIGEIGDVDIFFFSEIMLTPYDDKTAPFFDELSDEIDRVLF